MAGRNFYRYAFGYSGKANSANLVIAAGNWGPGVIYGWFSGFTGSYISGTFGPDGYTPNDYYSVASVGNVAFALTTPSDLGQEYLTSIEHPNGTLLMADASVYSYAGGDMTWQWYGVGNLPNSGTHTYKVTW